MPIIKSAIKRMRQTMKRRGRNVAAKRDLHAALKAFTSARAVSSLQAAQSEIDKAVKKNLLSKNTAARKKAKLAKIAKEAGVKLTANTKATTAKPAAPAKKATVAKKPAVKKPAAKKKAE
jgi:ribosomal protein S20